MKFYTKQHKYYCGVDLHARNLYVCIIDQKGEIVKHKNIDATPETFPGIIAKYRRDIVVAVECMFTWYWLADLCRKEQIPFVLGHALYMKAIHGGKAKIQDMDSFVRLQSVPGIGQTLALVILYEIHDIRRFPRVQDFVSYSRLVKCAKESAGKRYGSSGAKIGRASITC